jgi:hypothetical protein
MLNHGRMRIILFVAFALTGCTVAAGSRTSVLITSSHSAATISPARIGGFTDRFGGIRRTVTWDPHPEIQNREKEGVLATADYRAGQD